MARTIILGVHVKKREGSALDVQAVLTKNGCNIKTRIGLHDVADGVCSPSGIILLELCCEKAAADAMVKALKAVAGVEVQQMAFDRG